MQVKIQPVLDKILGLDDPAIDAARRNDIATLLENTVNGDDIADFLAINASVRDNIKGALVYILTDRRIIKFEIDPDEIKSVSFLLNTISGFERTLESGRAGVQLTFPNGSFGVRYAADNQDISAFFQKVDQARVSPAVSGFH